MGGDCGMLGGAGVKKKSHIFVRRSKKNPTIGQPTKCNKSKVWYLPFMSFLETEQSTPLASAPAANDFLGLLCSAWLAYLAILALLGLLQRHGQAADVLAWTAGLQPRLKMGGGAVLALQGLRLDGATDALACAACL